MFNRQACVCALLIVCVSILALTVSAQPDKAVQPQQPKLPPGLNIVVYQREGVPVVVHLHGASGDVHVWIVKEEPEGAGAAVDPVEVKRLEAIKKLAAPGGK